MGQHTWFVKSKELYDKQMELYEKLDLADNFEIYLDDLDRLNIESEIERIDDENDADFHDVFRTNKRQSDGSYIEEVISSRSECFEWINDPNNKVSFKNTYDETDEKERLNKMLAIEQLNQFWDKYPNGLIYFC